MPGPPIAGGHEVDVDVPLPDAAVIETQLWHIVASPLRGRAGSEELAKSRTRETGGSTDPRLG